MIRDRVAHLFSIYDRVMNLPSAQRKQQAAHLCSDDVDLLQEVMDMIEAAERMEEDTHPFDNDMRDAVQEMAVDILANQEDSMIGQTIGHYTVEELLGIGGMGRVYAARDIQLDRRVAIKSMSPGADPEWEPRFRREARVIASLNHEHIVTLYDIVEWNGAQMLVMELIDGQTLDHFIPEAGMSATRFLSLALPMVEALAEAHAKGIMHRDLKPGNIMIDTRGKLKVLDFGLARPVDIVSTSGSSGVITQTGRVVGTYTYMSPEQARGKPVDCRSDIFSLGIIFYEMLSGRRPFKGETPTDILSAIIKDDVPKLKTSGIPAGLTEIVLRCLEKPPENRYADAQALRESLHRLREDLASGRHRAMPGRIRSYVLAASISLLVTLGILAFWPQPEQPPVPKAASWDYSDTVLESLPIIALSRPKQNIAGTPFFVEYVSLACLRYGLPALITESREGDFNISLHNSQVDDITYHLVQDSPEQKDERLTATNALELAELVCFVLFKWLDKPLPSVEFKKWATTNHPKSLDSYFQAMKHIEGDKFDNARQKLDQVLINDPSFALAMLLQSRVLDALGRKSPATELIRRAGNFKSELGADYEKAIAMDMMSFQQYREAPTQWENYIGERPLDPDAYYQRAMSFTKCENPLEAMKSIRGAIELQPGSVYYQGYRLFILCHQSQAGEALKELKELRQQFGNHPYLYWVEALAHLSLEDWDQAKVASSEMTRFKNPYDSWGTLYLAKAEFLQGNFQKATEILEQRIGEETGRSSEQRQLQIQVWKARIYQLSGQNSAAELEIESIIEQLSNRHHSSMRFLRDAAIVCLELDREDDAERILTRLKELDSERRGIISRSCIALVQGYLDRKNGGKIRDKFMDVMAWSDVQSQFFGAVSLEERNLEKKAKNAYLDIVNERTGRVMHEYLGDRWVLAHYHIARLSRKLGHTEGAEEYSKRFLDLWGHLEHLKEVQEASSWQ
ncbi:MAG: protein kinase [Acidobacteriota bacterium]|nr:protein kinase [Acidobacteriota bacterium]